MDESRLRQQLCQAAYQLWVRGLIVGEGGQITAELHRRRYLTLPPHVRRANVQPEEIICVDLGGLNIQSGPGLSDSMWRLHRAAYRSTLVGEASVGEAPGRRLPVAATILAEPPIVMALMRLSPDASELAMPDCPPVPVLDGEDEEALIAALRAGVGVAVRSAGLLVATDTLAGALNWIERVDHAARVQLAVGSNGT